MRLPLPPGVALADHDAVDVGAGRPHLTPCTRGGVLAIVKRLPRRLVDEPQAVVALEREGNVIAALDGRGAPRLLDRGRDGYGPYLVVEVARGRPLAALGRAEALAAAVGVVDALAAVHEARDARGPLAIVHGDPSPANVIVAESGSARWIDFGLAGLRDAPLERSGRARGTLRLLAPEVARGEAATAASDVFAAALSIVEALLGRPARAATTAAAAIVLAAEEPIPLALVREAAPEPLASALASALAEAPERRPSAAELARLARAAGPP
ncbi:MAG: protein kinase [Myxococcales bacterium]|nr:protein kinase [Myxococcales bacterium]